MKVAALSPSKTYTEYSDAELVNMLKLKPKHVPALRTKEGFKRFFKDITREHLTTLLLSAYDALELTEKQKRKKLQRRMELMKTVFAPIQ